MGICAPAREPAVVFSDGLYQLEDHTAFTAWLGDDEGWADPFTRQSISDLF
ncbi:hypothetical protein [Lentzea sp. NPDC004782]|uniref:hypothetical protein n=1 Tax=Lentzea sp. NPDC004782 TaxID=3154458 RepID=UPI0033B2BA41